MVPPPPPSQSQSCSAVPVMYENYSFKNQYYPYVSLILTVPSDAQLLKSTPIREIEVDLHVYPGKDKSKIFGII